MKNKYNKLLVILIIAILALPLLFLKGCGSDWDGGERVTIRLGSEAGDEPTPLPPGVRFIEIAISGDDMTPVHRVVDTGGMGPVSETFNVAPGTNRFFEITAKDLRDETGTAMWTGSATSDIGTEPTSVLVEMAFVLDSDILPPDMPSDLFAESSQPGTLDISWSPTTDNYLVAGYYVYEIIDGEHFLVKSTTQTLFTESGLMAGTYCVSVSAIDAAGNESDLTVEQCIVVTGVSDELPPGAPGSLEATAEQPASITITWETPADVDPPVGYNIYNGDTVRFVSSSTGTIFTDTRLEGGTYCYNATSVDAWGNESGYAGPVCAALDGVIDDTTGDVEDPTTPAWLIASAVPMTDIALAWAEGTDNNAVAGYNIYEDTGSGYEYRTSSISNTLAIERLAPGNYCFEVSTVDATGNESALSGEACVLVGGNAYEPRVPNCPEFLTYYENPGGNYKWHPDSNPPKCYGDKDAPRTWWNKIPPGQVNK